MKDPKRTTQTSFFKRATRRNISEDGILHNHRRENLKSYNAQMLTVGRFTKVTSDIFTAKKEAACATGLYGITKGCDVSS
jgi:hypothetical protein